MPRPLKVRPVGKQVNSPRNNGAELLERIERRFQRCSRIALHLTQPCRPILWFQDHRHSVVQSADLSLAYVVMMVNERVTVPSGHLNPSHNPANAIG